MYIWSKVSNFFPFWFQIIIKYLINVNTSHKKCSTIWTNHISVNISSSENVPYSDYMFTGYQIYLLEIVENLENKTKCATFPIFLRRPIVFYWNLCYFHTCKIIFLDVNWSTMNGLVLFVGYSNIQKKNLNLIICKTKLCKFCFGVSSQETITMWIYVTVKKIFFEIINCQNVVK